VRSVYGAELMVLMDQGYRLVDRLQDMTPLQKDFILAVAAERARMQNQEQSTGDSKEAKGMRMRDEIKKKMREKQRGNCS
jgi:hypothetical protein